MDCRQFERQLQLYVDGLLSTNEREDVLLHAQTCPSCAALLQDMTELVGLLSANLCTLEPPAGFMEAVMVALPELYVKQVKRIKVSQPVWRRWGAVAAAAVLLVAAGVVSLLPGENLDLLPESDPGSIVAETDQFPDDFIVTYNPTITPTLTESDDQSSLPDFTEIESVDEIDAEILDNILEDENPLQMNEPTTNHDTIVIANNEEPTPYEGNLDLPQPALDPPQPGGKFSLTVLAAYKDCDAILPSFTKDGLVEFYTNYKSKNILWTQNITTEQEAQPQDHLKDLPTLTEITGSVDDSETKGFSYIAALSPDARRIAVNCGGEQRGIWLYSNITPIEEVWQVPKENGLAVSILGGGKVLSWSPNSNKLLYTDESGQLFIYYIFEQRIDSLYNGIVSCANWAQDSKTVVFSGKMEKSQLSAIYTIIVP